MKDEWVISIDMSRAHTHNIRNGQHSVRVAPQISPVAKHTRSGNIFYESRDEPLKYFHIHGMRDDGYWWLYSVKIMASLSRKPIYIIVFTNTSEALISFHVSYPRAHATGPYRALPLVITEKERYAPRLASAYLLPSLIDVVYFIGDDLLSLLYYASLLPLKFDRWLIRLIGPRSLTFRADATCRVNEHYYFCFDYHAISSSLYWGIESTRRMKATFIASDGYGHHWQDDFSATAISFQIQLLCYVLLSFIYSSLSVFSTYTRIKACGL